MKIGQKILLEFKNGKTPTELLNQRYPASKNTIYKYWRQYQLYKELSEKLWNLVWESS